MSRRLGHEELHHSYVYPYLSKIFSDLGDEKQRLFLNQWLIPPGFRSEPTTKIGSNLPLAVSLFPHTSSFHDTPHSAETLFYSIEAFSYQSRFNLLPDPGLSLAVLADLLYRLLLCCLPTNHGGLTADTLLLDSGRSVTAWAKAIVHLIDVVDQRVCLLDNTVADSSHPVRDAFCCDMLHSAIQGITWNLYQYHLFHTPNPNFCLNVMPYEEPHVLGNRLRMLLLNLLNLDTIQVSEHEGSEERKDEGNFKKQAGSFFGPLFVEHSTKTYYRKHKPHLCIEKGDWQPIGLASTYRLPAHLLRLVAALEYNFFSEYIEYQNELHLILSPWVHLLAFLTWELSQLCTKAEANSGDLQHETHSGKDAMLWPEDMETGFVTGLLIEAVRGTLSLISLSTLTLQDNTLCQRLLSILESIFQLHFFSPPSNLPGEIVPALKQKQFLVLHELAFSIYTQIPKRIYNSSVSKFYNALDITFMNNPDFFSSRATKASILYQISTSSHTASFGFVLGSLIPEFQIHLKSIPYTFNSNTSELANLVLYLARFFSQETSMVPEPNSSDTPHWTLNPKCFIHALVEDHRITLSLFSMFLSSHVPVKVFEHIVGNLPGCNSSFQTSGNLFILGVIVQCFCSAHTLARTRLIWMLYHSFLFHDYQQKTSFCIMALQSIYHTWCNTLLWDEQFYLTHLLLLTLQRNHTMFDALDISADQMLRTALVGLQSRVQDLLTLDENSSYLSAHLILIRLFLQLVAHLCIHVEQNYCSTCLYFPQFKWIPEIIFDVLRESIKICQLFGTVSFSSTTRGSFIANVVISLVVTEVFVFILNQSFKHMIQVMEEVIQESVHRMISGKSSDTKCETLNLNLMSDSCISLDFTQVLSQLTPQKIREDLLDSLWTCLVPLFDAILQYSVQNSTLVLALVTPMIFFELFLDGQDTTPISLPLPPLTEYGALGDTPWNTQTLQWHDCPVEVALNHRSVAYTDVAHSLDEFTWRQFGKEFQVEVSCESYPWSCPHSTGSPSTHHDKEGDLKSHHAFHFYNYLRTHYLQFSVSERYVSSLKQSYDKYWFTHLGPLCCVCMTPLPQLQRLGLACLSSVDHERFKRFPSTIRLVSYLTGAYSSNLLLRCEKPVNISLSTPSLRRFSQILLCIVSRENPKSVKEPDHWPLCYASNHIHLETFSEVLSLVIIAAGIHLAQVSNTLFPLVHWCLTNERQWIVDNNLCRLKYANVLNHPAKFNGHAVLLHLLESFTYLTLLIGLPLAQFSWFTSLLIPGIVTNEARLSQKTLVVKGPSNHFYTALCQQPVQLLSMNFLSSEEINNALLLLWRRVMDVYRIVLVAPSQLSLSKTLRVSFSWDITFPDVFERLSVARNTFIKILASWNDQGEENPFYIPNASILEDIKDLLSYITENSSKLGISQGEEHEKSGSVIAWVPCRFSLGYLIRGATPSGVSDLVTLWISLLRRNLKIQGHGEEIAFLFDLLNRTPRTFGLSNFPAFLSQLDTRPLLTLLASSHQSEESHLHLLFWWYGIYDKRIQWTGLLKSHLIRVGYHPLGRRTLQRVERIIGKTVSLLLSMKNSLQWLGSMVTPPQRGLMFVTNCSSWVSRCVPRLSQKPHHYLDRLRETWRVVIKQLFPTRLKLPDHSFEEHLEDFKRSEKILRASTEVQLLFREIWDLSGPWAVLHCPTLIHLDGSEANIKFIQSRLGYLHGSLDLHGTSQHGSTLPLELTTDAFFQIWEMLRCLWGERHEPVEADIQSVDLMMTKAFSCVEPLYVYGEIFTETLDGITLKRSSLFLTQPCYQSSLCWRICRAVHLFLIMLVQGVIKLVETPTSLKTNPLDQHVALTMTLLESLSNVSPSYASLECWCTFVTYSSPDVLHPFLPAIVRRFVDLYSEAPVKIKERLLDILRVILDLMKNYEQDRQGPLLSLFCELDIVYHIPDAKMMLCPVKRSSKQLAANVLCHAGSLLESPSYSGEVKYAVLFSLQACFKSLKCHSLSHIHTIAEIPFPSDYGARLVNSCIQLASMKPSRRCPVDLLVGSLLGLCGAYLAPTVYSSLVTDGVWWDGCPHFLAVRILERLIYPNLNNRVTLYYIQELLVYLDQSSEENRHLYSVDPSACCLHHDNPTTEVSIMDFVSENVKRLGHEFKSSRYTLSVMVPSKKSLHLLQKLARMLLKHIPSTRREVFFRSGLEFSSYLPDVLRFLLPHLFLVALSHLSEDDSSSAIHIAQATVNVLNDAKRHLEATRPFPGIPPNRNVKKVKLKDEEEEEEEEDEDIFSLYDPATTCQIVFETVDNLAQLFHTFHQRDAQSQLWLEKQSEFKPQLKQSLSLSLSSHLWNSLHTFLRITRGVDAALSAIKVGAFSRCLFYLETTYFSKSIPYGSETEPSESSKDIAQQAKTFVPMFLEGFHGLQNWDHLHACSEIVDLCEDMELKLEQIALNLQAHHQPLATAWEYIRLSHLETPKSHLFYCKALRFFLEAQAFGTFFLEYGKACDTVKALCLPLLIKSLWKTGGWKMLEYLYSNYSSLATTVSKTPACLSSASNSFSLSDWKLCNVDNKAPSSLLGEIPSLFDLPSSRDIFSTSSAWSMQDRGDFLLGGVLSALHDQNLNLTKARLECFSCNAVACLAKTTRDSRRREYLALVPLRLSADIQYLLEHQSSTVSSEEAIMQRVEFMMQSAPPVMDILDTLKVVSEEMGCLRTASIVSIHLSKMLRKISKTKPTENGYSQMSLCGKYQLSDYLRLLSPSPLWYDDLQKDLRMELSKCVPQAMRLEVLAPLVHLDDRAAVRYAKLSVSNTHLLPEKLLILQKVVEQHPQSERAHRCLAELLDTQIHNWTSRLFDNSPPFEEFNTTDIPQTLQDDLPHFPKGWSMISLVESAICHHLEAAAWSKSTRRARFHLLKFLQLLVDVFFCDSNSFPDESKMTDPKTQSALGMTVSTSYKGAQELFVERILTLTEHRLKSIPISHWYLEVSQLIARCQHKQLGGKIFQPLLARLLQHRAQQMAWHLGPWFCSQRKERHKTAHNILNMARVLESETNQANSSGLFVERTVTFISCLVTLAGSTLSPTAAYQDTTVKNRLSITKELPQLSKVLGSITGYHDGSIAILLPLLSQLDASPEKPHATPIVIHHVDDVLFVMRSKQRPKKLSLRGSNGLDYPWLVKMESRGDLRKDARLMEVAGYVNEWMEKVEKDKQKNLQIQRYSVIPLNEATGLIEWLPNLVTLRCAVLELWEAQLGQEKFINLMKKVIGRYSRHKQNPKALLGDFRETLHHFKPVLQKFFFDRFGTNVTVWYECRKTYSESLASWSILGFIFGLGDRHGENILINIHTGKIVHVDFDCLFGKGLQLPVPEVVPFRLTQNVIAALGFGGLKGGFLAACADTLDILKQYKKDFLSVLQSFVFDPLIEWTRTTKGDKCLQESHPVGGDVQARKFLKDVGTKLHGGVNFRSQKLLKPNSLLSTFPSQSTLPTPQPTLEEIYSYVTTWVIEPGITVETQVKELMEAASCHHNLSLMYLGWMPWV